MEFNQIFSSLQQIKKDLERNRRQRALNRTKSPTRSKSPISCIKPKSEIYSNNKYSKLSLESFSIPNSREELIRNYRMLPHNKLKSYKLDATEIIVGIIQKFILKHFTL